MKLGIVIGTVVATRKVDSVTSLKMLVVSYLNGDLVDTKKTTVCLDTVNAGSGGFEPELQHFAHRNRYSQWMFGAAMRTQLRNEQTAPTEPSPNNNWLEDA